jgi:hypothetical protein
MLLSRIVLFPIFGLWVQSHEVMPNIYYCNSFSRGSSMLRSALPSEEAKRLLKLQSAHYVGSQFPAMAQNQRVNFAVLRIFNNEIGEWRAGLYCFDADITDIEETLQACMAKPADAKEHTIEMTEYVQAKASPVAIGDPSISADGRGRRRLAGVMPEPVWRWLMKPWPTAVSTRRRP